MSEMKFLKSALVVAGLVIAAAAMAQPAIVLKLSKTAAAVPGDAPTTTPLQVAPGDEVIVSFGYSFAAVTGDIQNVVNINVYFDLNDNLPNGRESLLNAVTEYADGAGVATIGTKAQRNNFDLAAGLAGTLYGKATDPSDSTAALATTDGVFAKFTRTGGTANAGPYWLGSFKVKVAAGATAGIIDLATTRLAGVGQAGSTLRTAMTGSGNSAGYYATGAGQLNVVPEPGTIAAVVTGLAGLVAARRRK